MGVRAPASLPPAGLVGLDPSWSRLVRDANGYEWHVLDTAVASPRLTVLCVHGNPSWSFLWRSVLAAAPDDVRVVAVDQLDMGFSERTGTTRPLATRIDDLTALTTALDVSGPVVTVAHDWGGPISIGWALRHRGQLEGIVLTNTAVHQPVDAAAPSVIRLVRNRALLQRATVTTTAFIDGAIRMSKPALAPEVRSALLAPYGDAARREAIGEFVRDIPLDEEHPSAAALDAIAAGLAELADVPALLLWGARDPVFSDRYLHDLERRLPHAAVHRYPMASHFVGEDVDIAAPIFDWLADERATPSSEPAPRARLWEGLQVDVRRHVEATAAGMAADGIAPGDRVALMIPPGDELTVALYATWRAGAVAVLIDAGLGQRGMSRAIAAAAPDHLIGIERALAAAKALRWPGRRIAASRLSPAVRRLLGVGTDLAAYAESAAKPPDAPSNEADAAIVFTSGATGPSKGVRYEHHQLEAQRDAIASLYQITSTDRLVAAFAPFALYGPALGIRSVVPDMDVTAPGTLTAGSLGQSVVDAAATLVFASPAALANVVATVDELTAEHRQAMASVRLVLSAGAPVRAELLRDAVALFPNAVAHTPYGMTECLPVADISLTGIDLAGAGDGVCVGAPLPSVDVEIDALRPGCPSGEIVVRAAHQRAGYDRLWHTEFRATDPPGWHRTGDVGHLDAAGRLWVEGRLGHVVQTERGPVTPVGVEQAVEQLRSVAAAAAVGVGPDGVQQLVVVVQPPEPPRRPHAADLVMTDAIRRVVSHPVAAVLVVPRLPVDRRHNSKVDRTAVATWAAGALSGGRLGRL